MIPRIQQLLKKTAYQLGGTIIQATENSPSCIPNYKRTFILQ